MEAVETMSLGRRLFAQDEQSESPHLRDFLRIKEDETYNYGHTNFSGQTLDSILRLERGTGPVQVQSSRTLLDIIRDDPINRNENRKSWRHFRHRLRIRLQGSGPSGSGSAVLDAPSSLRVISHRDSNRFNTSIPSVSDPPQTEPGSSEIISNTREEAMTIDGETGEQPSRTSLMALLAENDSQMGFDGSVFVNKVEEQGEEEVEEKGGGAEYSCCVCMVRNKGAAFIPCGHTFCRLCCREIWIQRGNCPLCNSLILEILDIF